MFEKIKSVLKKGEKKTVAIFSFPHASKEQLEDLLNSVSKFGKVKEDIIFTTTDLRDGSVISVKMKGEENDS